MNTTAAQPALQMPPIEQLAVEAIGHMAADGYVSSMMKLPRPVLNELARRLLAPGATQAEAIAWLRADHGDECPNVSKDALAMAMSRFARRLGETYRLIWGQHSSRILMAELAKNPKFDADRLAEFAENRVMNLVAQEVARSTPGDLNSDRLRTMLYAIQTSAKRRYTSERLELDRQLAEQRVAKLHSEVELLRQKIEGLPDRIQAITAKLDKIENTQRSGGKVSPTLFSSIREELAGLAYEQDGGDA